MLSSHKIISSSLPQLASLLVVMLLFGALGILLLFRSHASPSLPGDINSDGVVNEADLQIIRDNYGQTGATANQGDLNNDNVVNIIDGSILFSHWEDTDNGPPTTGKYQFGMATSASGWPAGTPSELAEFDAKIDDMHNLGVYWVRMSVPWNKIEPSPGVWCTDTPLPDSCPNVNVLQHVLAKIHGNNMELIATVNDAPQWAIDKVASLPPQSRNFGCKAEDGSTANDITFDYDDFATYAAHIDAAFPGQIKVWEVSNSPNIVVADGMWAYPNACEYDHLMQKTYSAIKAADAAGTQSIVMNGGIGGTRDNNGNISAANFLKGMYDSNNNSSAGLFDAVAGHAYSQPNSPLQDEEYLDTSDNNNWNCDVKLPDGTTPGKSHSWCGMILMHHVMSLHGDGNKKIWITEYGTAAWPANKADWPQRGGISGNLWTSLLTDYLPPDLNVMPNPQDCFPGCSPVANFLGAGSANTQATMLKQAYQRIATYDWAGPLCWFTYSDNHSPQDSDNGFGSTNGGDFEGLVDNNGNHKPAYNMYKNMVNQAP